MNETAKARSPNSRPNEVSVLPTGDHALIAAHDRQNLACDVAGQLRDARNQTVANDRSKPTRNEGSR